MRTKRSKAEMVEVILQTMSESKPRITKEYMGQMLGAPKESTQQNKISTFNRSIKNLTTDDIWNISEILGMTFEDLFFKEEEKGTIHVGGNMGNNNQITVNSVVQKMGELTPEQLKKLDTLIQLIK